MRKSVRYSSKELRDDMHPLVEPLLGAALGYLEVGAVFPRHLSLLIGPEIEPLTGGRFEHRDGGLARIRLDTNRDGFLFNLAHELGHLLIDAATQPIYARSDGWLMLNEYAAERLSYALIGQAGLFDLDATTDKLEHELMEIQFLWRASVFYAGRAGPDKAENLRRAADRFITHFTYMSAAIGALPLANEESIWTRDLPDAVAAPLVALLAPAERSFPQVPSAPALRAYMKTIAPGLNLALSRLMKPRAFEVLIRALGSEPSRQLHFNRPLADIFEMVN